jgi:ATP-dependent Clp protease ATP-binding subunit ClpB
LRRAARLLADRGYTLQVSQPAGLPGRCGLRSRFRRSPLKRAIQRELQDPLALKILAGEFREGDTILVERGPEGLTFQAAVQGEAIG